MGGLWHLDEMACLDSRAGHSSKKCRFEVRVKLSGGREKLKGASKYVKSLRDSRLG